MVEAPALVYQLILAGTGPDQQAVQRVGQVLQRRGPFPELLHPPGPLLRAFFRPLPFASDPPFLNLPVVGGGEIPGPED